MNAAEKYEDKELHRTSAGLKTYNLMKIVVLTLNQQNMRQTVTDMNQLAQQMTLQK